MSGKLLQVVGSVIGVFAMVFGEFDDSPGLQGIGMILILSVLFSIYRLRRPK